MINHHPTPELLADYNSGAMRLSHGICIASHLEYCSHCRQQVAKLNLVGSHYFEHAETQSKTNSEDNEALKSKVLAMLDESIDESASESTNPGNPGEMTDGSIPLSLRQFVGAQFDSLEWSNISPSLKLATLCRDRDGAQIALSCVKPGGRLPHHRHRGEELTVVLEGSFSDESGVFHKGDFVARDASHKHMPVATKDAECICLIVLDEPIEFTGFFTRWLNPIVRRYHTYG